MISVAETVVRKRADLLDYVSKKFHKTVSVWTIGRILKEAGFVWKRMRKSCKPRRDEVLFAFFKEELRLLKQMEDNNEIELFFFDEAGFSLQPVVPYAWQRIGQNQIIPATQGKNFTVMGMIN
ncbi:MAG: winged helix-turn-helix domain-containing protein [Bacteroidota bacterium]